MNCIRLKLILPLKVMYHFSECPNIHLFILPSMPNYGSAVILCRTVQSDKLIRPNTHALLPTQSATSKQAIDRNDKNTTKHLGQIC